MESSKENEKEIRQVVMQVLSGKRILIISPESWEHIPVSKHHYSIELSKHNNKVFFLNPPSFANRMNETSFGNLWAVDYVSLPGINRLPGLLRNIVNQIVIQNIAKTCGGSFDIVWTFDPYRFQNLSLFGADIKVYHAVDIHFSKHEMEVAISSDIILAVSNMIFKQFESLNKPMLKLNHGLASHFLNNAMGVVEPYESKDKVRVGYVGNLDNWCIDTNTLLAIVKSHPQIEFNFIGPYKDDTVLSNLLKQTNHCKLHGKVPSDQLPDLFQLCDLFLMCYDGNNRAVNSNHHKILEYLATGKPVVMNYTDEYHDKRDIVCMSDENHELPEIFEQVVRNMERFNSQDLVVERRKFAQSNSYLNHLKRIDDTLFKI